MSTAKHQVKIEPVDTLVARFHEKFANDPLRFDSLPGVTRGWDSQKLVSLYTWFKEVPRSPQAEIAQALEVSRHVIARKVNSMNWQLFAEKLQSLVDMTYDQYMAQAAQDRRVMALANIAAKERRKDINREALNLQIKKELVESIPPMELVKLPPFVERN